MNTLVAYSKSKRLTECLARVTFYGKASGYEQQWLRANMK